MVGFGSKENTGGFGQIVASMLLGLCLVFGLVGLTASWGTASTNVAGVFRGEGQFTLWDITVKSQIIGIALPEQSYKIDDTICHEDQVIAELQEVCDKFQLMRTFTILTLIAAIGAFGCATGVLCMARKGHSAVGMAAAGLLSLLAAGCAAAALAAAMSLSRDNPYFEYTEEPAAGSICMALLFVLSLVAFFLEMCHGSRMRRAARETALPANAERAVAEEAPPAAVAPATVQPDSAAVPPAEVETAQTQAVAV